mgnify:CR=1 FL=1
MSMQCWGDDEDRAERRACSELAWAAGIFAALYVVTLLVWRACA